MDDITLNEAVENISLIKGVIDQTIKCFSKPTRGILRDIFQYINAANRAIKPTGNK
jgi:hypothetical protein